MRKDARDNRAAIVKAARELLSTTGGGVSMRQIAQEAGVGVATVSRHFPTRDELVFALINQAFGEIGDVVDTHVPEFDSDPRAAWRGALHGIVGLGLPPLVQAILRDYEKTDRPSEWFEQNQSAVIAVYERLLVPARAASLVTQDVNALRLHLGLAAIARPLPDMVETISPGQMTWLVDVYLDGLEHQAQGSS